VSSHEDTYVRAHPYSNQGIWVLNVVTQVALVDQSREYTF